MDSLEIEKQLNMSYNELVNYLLSKYGKAQYDYFRNERCSSVNQRVSRSSEGLFCHHIDEDKAIQLSSIKFARKNPFDYQKANRLVYCNILEHLIMHIKITLEPRHPDANERELPGLGGIKFIAVHLNDYFNGYEFKREWLKIAFELIKDNFSDYIRILRLFIRAFLKSNYPEIRLFGDKYSLIRRLSRGNHLPKVSKIYEQLIIPDQEDMISNQELKKLEIEAKEGSMDAQLDLGDLFEKGERVLLNEKTAFQYFETAAKQDSMYGLWKLGRYYDTGFGVSRDAKKALEYYLIVAEKEIDFAEHKVGICYLHGHGTDKDLNEAIKWLKKAAALGYLKSQMELGYIYYSLPKYKKNVLEAIKWYQLAATQKEIKALVELGRIYLVGKGVPQDLDKAEDYFVDAQVLGSKEADKYLKDYF